MEIEELMAKFDVTLVILSKKYYYGFFNQFGYMDWEDIAQELRLRIYTKYDKWDKNRNFNNWAYVVCMNRIRNMIDAKKCAKRGYQKCVNVEFDKEYNLVQVSDIMGNKVENTGPQFVTS